MNRASVVVCAVLLAAGLAGGGALLLSPSSGKCTALSEADKARLVSAIQLKYNLASTVQLGVADAGPVSGSCFRKLIFANLSRGYFHAELFASPDFRFLSKDLVDARPNPNEVRQRRRKVAEALTGPNAPMRGAGSATITLAVFSDFQCPFCARLIKTVDGLANRDRLRVVYHYFPLSGHKWARSAAEAAACAQRQSGTAFWSLHDYLFTHQPELSLDLLGARVSDWARAAPRLDLEQFNNCVSRSLTSGQVDQDVALGNELGVVATPSLFVDGDLVENTSPEGLRASIARASLAR